MGPLNGYTVLELAGIGPAPMGGMVLADMGAEVIRIDRASNAPGLHMTDVSSRGKKSVALNLKDPAGIETLLRMVENADVIIDPFRPGVCEKLGIGPDVCFERNPGRKGSMITSAFSTMRNRVSMPAGSLRFSATDFLPRVLTSFMCRPGALPARSMRITSAPISASTMPPMGAGPMPASSSTV